MFQRRHDILDAAPAKGRQIAVCQRRRGRGAALQPRHVAGFRQRLFRGVPFGLGQVDVGKARVDRVARIHPRAGQAQIFPDPPRRAGQKPGPAHVRDQADPRFRHRNLRRIADHPVPGMPAHAHAAAHDEALHERHDRLFVIRDGRVHAVFVGEKALSDRMIARAPGVIDRRDVAAGAERAVPLGVDDDQRHGVVAAPIVQRAVDRHRHLVAQRVQRLRAGKGDPARAPVLADGKVAHACPRSARSARLTIRRMISLVPSRIWWTRRSRTIFSTPKSAR